MKIVTEIKYVNPTMKDNLCNKIEIAEKQV